MRLQRYSEPYAATGGQAAEGVVNQLGRPGKEPLEVLVREAVQNCVDAGVEGETVEVTVGRVALSPTQRDALVTRVVPDPPSGLGLGPALVRGDIDLLFFADWGTKGLGGPTRANVDDGSPRDFVDFVRNIGQPPDTLHSGGSYGYGKAAFYLVSRAGTVLVDTLSRHDGERRFIAYGLGSHYTNDHTPFTGRHWWAVMRDGVPEPAVDMDAAELAEAVGLPTRREGSDFGTTVAVVAPRLTFAADDEDCGDRPEQALDFIARCLLWNFWPKMVAQPGGTPALRFSVIASGRPSEVPDPSSHDRIAPFVEALEAIRSVEPPPAGNPFLQRTEELCLKPTSAGRAPRPPTHAHGRGGGDATGARGRAPAGIGPSPCRADAPSRADRAVRRRSPQGDPGTGLRGRLQVGR